MCGISGTIGFLADNDIRAMVKEQVHRGPDDDGVEMPVQLPPVYFGHNRLSILDLSSRGHQPMFNTTRNLCITYNGEVYNFQELREELESLGYTFRSHTDTEVVLNAYDCWGQNCFERFNGMFALAILDKQKNKIILARDRLGIKPLYYWTRSVQFAFASEIKALLKIPAVRKSSTLNHASIASYVSMLWCPGTETPFHHIRRLDPGTFMEFYLGTKKIEIQRYWKLTPQKKHIPFKDAREEVLRRLEKAVKRRMIADVKVGAFLSGGLDSSAIAKLMADFSKEKLETFTISFSKEDQKLEAMMDDYHYAKKLADEYHFKLHQIEASAKTSHDLLSKIVYHLDEPIGDPAAINTYLIAKLAKERGVTILLSGHGSDEIFGGYRKHLACLFLQNYQRLIPSFFRKMTDGFLRSRRVVRFGKGARLTRWAQRILLDKSQDDFKNYYSLCSFLGNKELSEILAEDLMEAKTDQVHRNVFYEDNTNYLNQMCYTDTNLFLSGLNLLYCDKATMAASIECRVPFVDHELVEYAFTLPASYKIKFLEQKYILKKALKSHLPKEIIYRPKMPFSSPIRSWVKGGLRDLVGEYLSPSRIRQQGLFQAKGVEKLIDEDKRGIRDHAHTIYGLLTFQIWMEKFQVRA